MTNKQDLPETGEELQESPMGTELEQKQEDAVCVEEVSAPEGTPMSSEGGQDEPVIKQEEPPQKKTKKKPKEEKGKEEPKKQKLKVQDIVTIEDERTVQTDDDKAKSDLLDLQEAAKSGKILTGVIQGYEKTNMDLSGSRVVVYYGACKILISSMKLVEEPENLKGKAKETVYAMMAQKRLGAEIEFMVKTVDEKEMTAVANRLEAMAVRRENFYHKKNGIIQEGSCAEARVMAVSPSGIWVEIFGVETFIPIMELGYQRIFQPAQLFQPGQRVLVKILTVNKSNGKVKVTASVKQAQENPFEREIWKFTQGNLYLGKVTMVNEHGVYVALDGGVDCLCSFPTRGRPPRGARVTVKITSINPTTSRIKGYITHVSAKL